jgi:predicted TIM-barrel fold metal-dependent hydrolase
VAEAAAANSDVLIPFASIDPAKGKLGAREARRLIQDFGIRGFKFHPTMQGFYPNDRSTYVLYEAIAEAGAIALFHTGQTGVGSGMRGGNGMRLKFSNPMYGDDVAVDFPDMPIILAHPSFPMPCPSLKPCSNLRRSRPLSPWSRRDDRAFQSRKSR